MALDPKKFEEWKRLTAALRGKGEQWFLPDGAQRDRPVVL
jgi:hypothetical protein